MKTLDNLKKFSNFNLSNVMGGAEYRYDETNYGYKDEIAVTICGSGKTQRGYDDALYNCDKGEFVWTAWGCE